MVDAEESVTWADGPGVVTLPDGRRVRGRGLRRGDPDEPLPEFGIYLLGTRPDGIRWPNRWVRCPDFRVPADPEDAVEALKEAYRRAEIGRASCRERV